MSNQNVTSTDQSAGYAAAQIVLSTTDDPEETRTSYQMASRVAKHDHLIDEQYDGTWTLDLGDLPEQLTIAQARDLRDELNQLIRGAHRLEAGYNGPNEADTKSDDELLKVLPSYIAAWSDDKVSAMLDIPRNEVAEYRMSGSAWSLHAFVVLVSHLEENGVTFDDMRARAKG